MGGIWAVLFQQELILRLASDNTDVMTSNIKVVWAAFFDGVTITTSNAELDKLLSGELSAEQLLGDLQC